MYVDKHAGQEGFRAFGWTSRPVSRVLLPQKMHRTSPARRCLQVFCGCTTVARTVHPTGARMRPLTSPPEKKVAARFWSKVDLDGPGGCWLWTAGLQTAGYGSVWVDSATRTAHKVSWEWVNGPVPDGLQLDHTCRVRHCVNPLHLEAVTSKENSHRSPISLNTINATKTACPRGHPYDYTHPRSGKRACLRCSNGVQPDSCAKGHPYKVVGGRRWCAQCSLDKARA